MLAYVRSEADTIIELQFFLARQLSCELRRIHPHHESQLQGCLIVPLGRPLVFAMRRGGHGRGRIKLATDEDEKPAKRIGFRQLWVYVATLRSRPVVAYG